MMIRNTSLAVLLAMSVSGCATQDHVMVNGKCVTCINNPLTGEPWNHDGTLPGSTYERSKAEPDQSTTADSSSFAGERKTYTEQQTSFLAPVDVDLAFIKVKKEYGYYTEQEIRQEWGSMANMKMKTFAYAYDATPSVYYRMRAARKQAEEIYVIDHQIEKKAMNESQITITVWVNDQLNISPAEVAESLATRTKKALNI